MSGMPNKPSGGNPRPGTSPAAGSMYKEYVPFLGDWQVSHANPGNKMVYLEDRYYNPVTGQKISGREFSKNYLPELREQHWSNIPNKPIDTSALGAMGSTAPVTSNSPIANNKVPGNRPLFPPTYVIEEYKNKIPAQPYRDPWANRNQIPSASNNRRTK